MEFDLPKKLQIVLGLGQIQIVFNILKEERSCKKFNIYFVCKYIEHLFPNLIQHV